MFEATNKFLASFFKSDWTLRDYPLRYRHQEAEPIEFDPGPEHTLIPWTVQIINWWQMAGNGNSRMEAYADMEQKFLERKAQNDGLPRPGTGAPLEWADSTEVQRFSEIAEDFFQKVLGFEDDESPWISDESSLYDFELILSIAEMVEKTREVYGLDISDVKDLNIAGILARIAEQET